MINIREHGGNFSGNSLKINGVVDINGLAQTNDIKKGDIISLQTMSLANISAKVSPFTSVYSFGFNADIILSNKFVVAYTNSSKDLLLKVGTISSVDYTISFGNALSCGLNYAQTYIEVCSCNNGGDFIVSFNDGVRLYACVCTLNSDDTITFRTPVQLTTSASYYTQIIHLKDNQFILKYQLGNTAHYVYLMSIDFTTKTISLPFYKTFSIGNIPYISKTEVSGEVLVGQGFNSGGGYNLYGLRVNDTNDGFIQIATGSVLSGSGQNGGPITVIGDYAILSSSSGTSMVIMACKINRNPTTGYMSSFTFPTTWYGVAGSSYQYCLKAAKPTNSLFFTSLFNDMNTNHLTYATLYQRTLIVTSITTGVVDSVVTSPFFGFIGTKINNVDILLNFYGAYNGAVNFYTTLFKGVFKSKSVTPNAYNDGYALQTIPASTDGKVSIF